MTRRHLHQRQYQLILRYGAVRALIQLIEDLFLLAGVALALVGY